MIWMKCLPHLADEIPFRHQHPYSFHQESPLFEHVIERYAPFSSENFACISVVTLGELKSFAIQRTWGTVNQTPIIECYSEIDAFSQNLLPDRPLGKTPRNMGKNDIWIAATASVADAVLLTTDHDFDHLNKVFLQLERL
jgi:tRNA(fMet)-specific endonuclease VapC